VTEGNGKEPDSKTEHEGALRPVKLVDLAALIPFERNARIHSEEQIQQIIASIKEFGWTNPILTDGDKGILAGHDWHWVMDDNIRRFYRFDQEQQIPVGDGTIFRAMEDFALRFENVAMAGPNYFMFVPRKDHVCVFSLNTRIYSCNLIGNELPYRWRGRYNEDTDLSLRMLKAGWCTVQFNCFLQLKAPTQTVKGGCNKDFYQVEGTLPKSQMLVRMHPDVTKLKWKFNRWHHEVDYRVFRHNRLRLKHGVEIPSEADDYGMRLAVVS
jgi:hypothetical protein